MTSMNETVASETSLLEQAIARPEVAAKSLSSAQPSIADSGIVRLGAQGATLRRSSATIDKGRVRVGAQRMLF